MSKFIVVSGLALAATLLAIGAAGAQDHPRRHARHVAARHAVVLAEIKAPPLTVLKRRSFLDPGNVVPVGSDNEYLTANTTENRPIYNSFAPDRFGEANLPHRFDLPGNERFEPANDLDFSPF